MKPDHKYCNTYTEFSMLSYDVYSKTISPSFTLTIPSSTRIYILVALSCVFVCISTIKINLSYGFFLSLVF